MLMMHYAIRSSLFIVNSEIGMALEHMHVGDDDTTYRDRRLPRENGG